jgi:flagellar biosynthesis/type III secretory pathway protein FliH
MLPSRNRLWLALLLKSREFKPVRFFVMMALAAFVVCGVTAFYTHRAAHGRTAEARSAYAIALKAGEQTPADAILPTDAELNMMAQKYFKQQESGDRQGWDLAFENGYADGLKKTHGR